MSSHALFAGILRQATRLVLPSDCTTCEQPLTDDPTGAPEEANLLQGAGLLLAGAAVSALLLRRFPTRPADAA